MSSANVIVLCAASTATSDGTHSSPRSDLIQLFDARSSASTGNGALRRRSTPRDMTRLKLMSRNCSRARPTSSVMLES